MTPLLTAVVPTYGVESYVEDCLASLAHPDVEVIVVGPAPAHTRAARVVGSETPLGLGAARNLGLSLATGAYVWFVDGDDLLTPEAVPRVRSALASQDADLLLVGHARLVGRRVAQDRSSTVHCGFASLRDRPALMRVRQAAWNRIVRTDLLRRTGIRFPDGLYEDVPFSHEVLACARRIASLPDVCYLYRSRRASLTHTAGPAHFDVFTQYERLFATLSGWRASPRLLARVHAVMVRHYLAVLGAPDRVPAYLRRAFFARAVDHERRYRPLDGPPLSPGSWAIRSGSYDAYRAGFLAKRVWAGCHGG